MSETIRVAGIVNDSITDGPGLRLAIFMQGCQLNCLGCHNPEARALDGGTEYYTHQLWQLAESNPLLSGVTFSGGEPLLQAAALTPLARLIRQAGLGLAIYTGYTFEQLLRENQPQVMGLLALADTLVDGPFILPKRTLALPFRGSANQRILDAQKSLRELRPVLRQDAAWAVTG